MRDYSIIQGDVRETLKQLESNSVQCVVTSPPYYGLRDYGVEGQIGLEKTPEAYVQNLVEVFREVKRVLKDDGTLWLNLGDSYWGGKGQSSQAWSTEHQDRNTLEKSQHQITGKGETRPTDGKHPVIKPKDLIGIPWLVAFALRADGWYLRQDIIWAKPNPMPESVKDRCTKSHEYIFLLSKGAQYYYDAEAIAEPSSTGDIRSPKGSEGAWQMDGRPPEKRMSGKPRLNPDAGLFRNKRDVWTVTTKPYKGAHFATFPPDLIEPCILAGTSERGECPKCGKAWVRMTESSTRFEGGSGKAGRTAEEMNEKGKWRNGNGKGNVNIKLGPVVDTKTIGWNPQCGCGLDPIPQTVLDPFNGSGTTGAVSLKHRRKYIGCELNPEYIELTKKRFSEIQIEAGL